jgi:hypothetical protein
VEQKLSFQSTFLHLADVFPGTKMATITEKMYPLSTKKRSLHFCNFGVKDIIMAWYGCKLVK